MNSLPIGYWQPGRNSTTGQCQSSHRVSCLLWDGHGPGIWGLGHESFTGASPASLLQLCFASLHRCRSRGRLLVRQKFATLLSLTATQWIETKAALKVQGGCKLFFFLLQDLPSSLCLSPLLPFVSQLYSFVTCLFAVLVLVCTSFYPSSCVHIHLQYLERV